jgi:hypothetical protein
MSEGDIDAVVLAYGCARPRLDVATPLISRHKQRFGLVPVMPVDKPALFSHLVALRPEQPVLRGQQDGLQLSAKSGIGEVRTAEVEASPDFLPLRSDPRSTVCWIS